MELPRQRSNPRDIFPQAPAHSEAGCDQICEFLLIIPRANCATLAHPYRAIRREACFIESKESPRCIKHDNKLSMALPLQRVLWAMPCGRIAG